MIKLLKRHQLAKFSITLGILQLVQLATYQPVLAGDIRFSETTKLMDVYKSILPPPVDSRQIRASPIGKVPKKYSSVKFFLKSEIDVCQRSLEYESAAALDNSEYNDKLQFISYNESKINFVTKFKELKKETDQLLDEQNIRANQNLNNSLDVAKEGHGNRPIPRTFSTIREDLWATQDIILKKYTQIYSEFVPALEKELYNFDGLYNQTNKIKLKR
ncbi:MAG TPA: hypothetical protein VGK03_12150, partial [Geothrix sp.]